MTAQCVALWGEDHPVLDEVAVAELGERLAVALSRGRFPKPYAHVDPNEDAVLAALGSTGRLLAVADGHYGFDAARAALEAVAQRVDDVADDPGEADPAASLVDVCAAAERAVTDAVAVAARPRCDSRTALTLVLATNNHLHVATYGDTVCVRVRKGRAKTLGHPVAFLGPGSPMPRVQTIRRRAGDHVVVASDGLTDYLGRDWPARVAGVVEDSTDAPAAVRQLVELAMTGGAGDHIAVGVLL